ncbi:MAG TPA: C4-type zinc ribbon domain-containing protein [Candidatus Acidoferrales bacterium]|nr:C4-type zinc ribbon domain-containing protein [Candidatus Acidoferrales bacterium]
MHTGLKELLQVQTLDLKLAELAGQLARFPRRIAEVDAQVEAARGVLTKTREAQTASLKDRKKLELDVEVWKEKVRKYKDQSGQVKTNEAYRALVHEIEGAEAEIRKAEDTVLEHMVASEEHDRQVKAGEKALAETEATTKAAKQQIEAERAATTDQQTALRAEREAAAAAVPEKLYERYRVYAPRHHGVAVATVDGEACSGCRVHLRPYVVQRISRPDYSELEECESCGRMLYFEEPPAAPAAAGTAASVAQSAGPQEPAQE